MKKERKEELVKKWDESAAKDVAMEADYIYEDDKHYCPKCYSYNDEDELVINLERKK